MRKLNSHWFFTLLTGAVFLTACGGGEGPCDYDVKEFNAKVERYDFVEMNDQGDSVFTVWVDFSAGSLSDELQDLGQIRGIEFTREKIYNNQAFLGNSFTGTISDPVSGNCERIVSFNQKER